MLPAQLKNLSEALLAQACADRWPETLTLEFKRDLPGTGDKEKGELCKDVSAMANADGGDIVYGIAEDNGAADALVPITAEGADSAKRRLGQVLAGVEPRINGLQLQEVAIAAGGYALVIRVPASFDGPHRFGSRFVARTGTHIMDLTYDQLRSAFGRRASIETSVKAFIAERREMINQGQTRADLRGEPATMVHLVPLSSFTGRGGLNLQQMESDFLTLRFSDWGGAGFSRNLDGVLVAPGGDRCVTYVQAFRNGAFECVRYARAINVPDGKKWIWAGGVTAYIREAFQKLIAAAKNQGATGPAVFAVSLHRVGGFTWMVSDAYNMQHAAVADRPELHLPDVLLENVEDVPDCDVVLRPLLDVLWQCFDVERCREYNASGKWTPR